MSKIDPRDLERANDAYPAKEKIVKKHNQNADTTKGDHGKEIKSGRRKIRRRSNSSR